MTVKDVLEISLGDDIHIDSVDNMALITTNCYEYRNGVGGINGFSVIPNSGVSESVDSPDVDRL